MLNIPLRSDAALPHEDGCNEGGSPAATVGGEHQVELVVKAHELADAGAHDVGEVRVEPKDGAIDGHHHVVVVHLLEQGGNACRGHEGRPSGDALAHVAQGGAIVIGHIIDPKVGQRRAAAGEVAHLVGLDLGDILGEEAAPPEDVGGVLAGKDEPLLYQVHQHVSHHLAHVHAGDHLFEDLLPRVDRALVDPLVPLGENKVKLPMISEGAPLSVDDDVSRLASAVLIPKLHLKKGKKIIQFSRACVIMGLLKNESYTFYETY